MNTDSLRKLKFGAIALVAAAACLLALPSPIAPLSTALAAADDQETQDIVHMRDGRVLTGKVLSETPEQIIFRFVDRRMNIATQITLNKRDVLNLERNVPVQARAASTEPAPAPAPSRTERRARGLAEGDAADESLPSLYVIPMKGQMGTDIHPEIYRAILDDIRKHKPDKVIWQLNCSDIDDILAPRNNRREIGLVWLFDDYRELVRMLQDDLRGIDQVMWVHDAFGISSIMALAWPEMYMTPSARLWGMVWFYALAPTGDVDFVAKNREYLLGAGNSFLERGRRSIKLGHAMMNPKEVLSASWRGREVIWRLDTNGEYIVNSDREQPAWFRAKTAEDFGISRGTAETLDDLAMLLGYREYRVIEGDAPRMVNRYVEDWRRQFENVQTWWDDHAQHREWAQGDQQLMYLGRARNDLERILQAMNRYAAVEIRFRMLGGPSKFQVQTILEQLNEEIRALRDRDRGRPGGGRGGGGGMGGRG